MAPVEIVSHASMSQPVLRRPGIQNSTIQYSRSASQVISSTLAAIFQRSATLRIYTWPPSILQPGWLLPGLRILITRFIPFWRVRTRFMLVDYLATSVAGLALVWLL